ncbi:MAG: hypothetical protein ABL997_16535 [Planctomycetota bacterium]
MTRPAPNQKRKDPELTRQLEAATLARRSMQAVFFLRSMPTRARTAVPVPEETRETVRALIERVERETGEHVEDFNVFPSLASFVLKASPRVVEFVFEQEEIASATANQRSTD